MRSFKIARLAQQDLDEAAAWYEHQEIRFGFEFIEEIDRVLVRIETQETFVTAPLDAVPSSADWTRGPRRDSVEVRSPS